MENFEIDKGDTLNIRGRNLHPVERVTDKAVLLYFGNDNEMKPILRWIPKSVLKIIGKSNLTSIVGIVYDVSELPYWIEKKLPN